MTELVNVQRVVALIGTEAEVEAFSADLIEGLMAFASDTDAVGIFDGSVWNWSAGGSATPPTSGRWEVLMTDAITDPPDPLLNEDGTDWLYGEVLD